MQYLGLMRSLNAVIHYLSRSLDVFCLGAADLDSHRHLSVVRTIIGVS